MAESIITFKYEYNSSGELTNIIKDMAEKISAGQQGAEVQVYFDDLAASEKISVGQQGTAQAHDNIYIPGGDVIVKRSSAIKSNWNEIRKAGKSLPVGTEVSFKLKGGERTTAVIVDHDHYDTDDTVFWIRQTMGTNRMNLDFTNAGGYDKTYLRKVLNDIFYKTLPDDLQAIIKPHTIYQMIDGKITESAGNRLYLPSVYEIEGENDMAEYNGKDKQMPYFEMQYNRVAYNKDGETMWYWTADPSADDATAFCLFGGDGYSYASGAAHEGGVAPLFVI